MDPKNNPQPQNQNPTPPQAQPATQTGQVNTPPAQQSPAPSQPATPNLPKMPPQAPPANSMNPAASANTPPPKIPKKRGIPMVVIFGVVFLIFVLLAAGIAFLLLSGGQSQEEDDGNLVIKPSGTPIAGPREHTFEEYPNFQSVEITEDTVAFNKVDDSFRIRYRDQIFHEQDTGSFTPREVFPENKDEYKWYGLVNAPDDLIDEGGAKDQLFSFKAPLTYKSFVFIMRWDNAQGERYKMYRFYDNQVEELLTFTEDRLFYVPVLDNFSLGGNFLSIKLLTCPTCYDDYPEIVLYHIPTGESRNIGQVSYFEWAADDSKYEYREYREGIDPSDQPLLRNDFFEQSVVILES